jgi:salicylate hydroxylase
MMARGAEEVEVPSELVPELSEGVRGRRPAAPGHDDREPLSQWSTAGTTLLGDACHPMLPFLAQGAGQAIEDAAALTRCLSDTPDDVSKALARYEAARLPHTARIQRMSWDNNTFYHMPDGPEQEKRDALLSAAGAPSGLASLGWLHGNDPEEIPA